MTTLQIAVRRIMRVALGSRCWPRDLFMSTQDAMRDEARARPCKPGMTHDFDSQGFGNGYSSHSCRNGCGSSYTIDLDLYEQR